MNLKIELPAKQNQFKQIDNRWSQLKLQTPFTPRQAFAFCSQGNIGYLHGGYNCDEGILGDMYMAKFGEPDDRKWYPIKQEGKNIPGKLRYHTLTSYLFYLICLGGQKSQSSNNCDIFCFNLKTHLWGQLKIVSENQNMKTKQIQCLLSRDSHCAVLNQTKIFVFGGYSLNKGQYLNSILRLNLSNIDKDQISIKLLQFQKSVKLPSPRSNFASCSFNKNIYIFGGTDSIIFFEDLWSFNYQTQTWTDLTVPETDRFYWPEKRKGACLVAYPESRCLILFGGMQTITKQQNELSVYLTEKNKWVKVHSNTNNIYDPSPTLKLHVQTSPTIISHKNKRQQKPQFRIGVMKALDSQQEKEKEKKMHSKSLHKTPKLHKVMTKSEFNSKTCKTQMQFHHNDKNNDHQTSKTSAYFFSKPDSQHKMSVVQQKKYRQFLARKKRLLQDIYNGSGQDKVKRPLSPTSQCLNYTLNQLGQQREFDQSKNPEFHLPKVIFDDRKLQVIGKKPCARDGHAAFVFEKNMYIIGGDRHMVSFNDTHLLRLDKTVEFLSYYS